MLWLGRGEFEMAPLLSLPGKDDVQAPCEEDPEALLFQAGMGAVGSEVAERVAAELLLGLLWRGVK